MFYLAATVAALGCAAEDDDGVSLLLAEPLLVALRLDCCCSPLVALAEEDLGLSLAWLAVPAAGTEDALGAECGDALPDV